MLAELDQVLAQVEPFDLATLEKAVHDYAERTGRKMGDVVNPLRVAVTGQGVGPGLYDCLVILGRETCRARIEQTLDMLEQALHSEPCARVRRLPSHDSTGQSRMRIFVTGSIAYDYIMVFPGRFRDHILPDKMHVLSVSFLVDSLTRRRGGTGANIAYNLGLLGERPVLVGTVGEDFGEYRAWLESHGVDCRTVKVIAGEHTASCFINTDLQDNQITAFYPGAMAHAASLSLAEAGVTPDDLVVIAPNDPVAMNRYTAECIEAGIPYLYDPSMQLPRLEPAELEKGCRGARILAGNDYEFGMMAEKLGLS